MVATPSASSTCSSSMGGTILGDMGLDPTRPHRTSRFDYWYVAAGIIVAIALVLWAFFG